MTAAETCLNAPVIDGTSGTLMGSYGLLNDYQTNHELTDNWQTGCTGTSVSSGREVVVGFQLGANEQLTVTVDATCASCNPEDKQIDEVIYLLNTCPSDGTSFDGDLDNCVAGAHETGANDEEPSETFSFTNTGDAQTFYVVVDAWCNEGGYYCPTSEDTFYLEWQIQ